MPASPGAVTPPTMHSLVRLLQQLPASYHWVYADEGLQRAIAIGAPVKRGPRGRRLYMLLRLFNCIGAQWWLLWLVGTVELHRALAMQRREPAARSIEGSEPDRYFVGFGAGAEEVLSKRYCDAHPGEVARLNHVSMETFARKFHLSAEELRRNLVCALQQARGAIAALPPELAGRRFEFLTFVGLRLAHYAYLRAWFSHLATNATTPVQEIAFLVPDTSAFAAVDVKLPAAFIQHGLITCSVMPGFSRIAALTEDEAAFFREQLPQVQVSISRWHRQLALAELNNKVMLASVDCSDVYRQPALAFLEWIHPKTEAIVVRPHPLEDRAFWSVCADKPNVKIEADADFFTAMETMRPRLVVSWNSTTLADTLDYDVIPVTLCTDDDRNAIDMVYPIFHRCLRWPRDSILIARCLQDDDCYRDVLKHLQKPGPK